MSFKLQLGKINAPRNKVNKNPSFEYTTSGTLRSECDLINPVILVKCNSLENFAQFNYMYIADFKRYYYVSFRSVREGIAEIHGHVDVLFTYKDQILNNTGLVLRTATKSQITKMLDDGCFKTYSDDHIVTQKFTGDTFTSGTFVLAVAGS